MADASSPASNQSTMASQILTTLGAGSGIDIHKMAQDLTDVERMPKEAQINESITETNAQISAYGLVTYQLGILKTAFEGINDASEMSTSTSTSTNATAVNFSSLDGTAQEGSYDVSVSALANGQQSKSSEYASKTTSLNSGTGFDLLLAIGPTGGSTTTKTISVATDTPQGVVNAINATDHGVTATLVDTGTAGTNYRIILSGTSGAKNAFTVSTTATGDSGTDGPELGFYDRLASYNISATNSDITGATANQNLTFTVDGKTATVDLYDETASSARYTSLFDSNFLTEFNNQLTAQGIDFTASSSLDGSGLTFWQGTAAEVGSVSATIDGLNRTVNTWTLNGITYAGKGSTMQTATDSAFTFNGLSITRSSNTIDDVVTGAVLSLNQVTATSSAANPVRLNVSKDTSTLQTKIEEMVAEYNNFNGLMSELGSNNTDEDNEMMGALRRDSATVRYVQNQLRTAILADSSTTSGAITGLRDLGVEMDKSGNLVFDEDDYKTAITGNYQHVVKMLTANTDNHSLYATDAKGLAQDIATKLEDLTDSDGVLLTRNTSAEDQVKVYEEDLAALEKRYEAVYDRYLAQFTAMETMMESMNGTKDYLEGQLESLSKAYDND
jgi:flagellar hook-associated protein 2